ncbi:MAG: hypothetical protein JW810_14640 [Sedimentisphaerales bacterium]|nr:hypothetical protein [Sedimentisphaerales bacterium]
MPLGCIAILLALAGPNESVHQTDSVRLAVHIQSNLYSYTLTNRGASPIVAFEIPYYASYSFTAPAGWQIDGASGILKAWTDDPSGGIEPERSGAFSLRVSSQGATLGEATATVRFADGRQARLEGVWAPAAESRRYYFWITGILAGIFLLHCAILRSRPRRPVSPTTAA